jgi:hypothetical protein
MPRPIFGYLRRLPGMDKEAVHRALKELVAFTEREKFFLTGVHYESRPSERLEVWAALILDCRGDEVSDIVVPSADHFHSTPEIAAFMREELAEKIRGTVWLADLAGRGITMTSETAAPREP